MHDGVLRVGNAVVARKIAHINGIIAVFGHIERPRRSRRFAAVAVGVAVIAAARARVPGARFCVSAVAVFDNRRRLGIAVGAHHQRFHARALEHRPHIIGHPFIGVLVFPQFQRDLALPLPHVIGMLNAVPRAQTDAFARKCARVTRPRDRPFDLPGLPHR